MWVVLILFIAGIAVGRLLSTLKLKTGWVDRLLFYVVLIFLWVLGAQAGSDEAIINNFGTLGLSASIIAIAATAGSIILVRIFLHRKSLKSNH